MEFRTNIDSRKLNKRFKSAGYLALALFLIFSCKDTEPIDFTTEDNTNLQTEEKMEAYLEEVSDMTAAVVIADPDIQNGIRAVGPSRLMRIISGNHGRCASVSLEFASDNVPEGPGVVANLHGYITLDYGSGCASIAGTVRKGRIIIEFKGRRFVSGSSFKITFESYGVDGITLVGFREEMDVQTNCCKSIYQTETVVTFTFPDGTIATRTGNLRRSWWAGPRGIDMLTVGSGATGKTRDGKDYTVTTTKGFTYSRGCVFPDDILFMPLEGTKELVIESRKITVDYGELSVASSTGSLLLTGCNNEVTVAIDGKSKAVDIVR